MRCWYFNKPPKKDIEADTLVMREEPVPEIADGQFLLRSMYDNFLDALSTTDRTRVLMWTLCAAALALQRLTPRSATR